MIPNSTAREIVSDGVTDSAEFGISHEDSAHIMGILRDTLYSDKVLAVLREYGSNAWDAHREAGKRELPIRVTLPTTSSPTLSIRDFGLGLSHAQVFDVYTKYGKSTKRGNDDSVGMLGIGSKSGFAYSDSFTIVSWSARRRRTYVAALDESEKGAINLIDEADCGDETGVEIKIPVKTEDLWEFKGKARELFRHFDPRPEINVDLPPLPEKLSVLQNGSIVEGNGEWHAIMGCVPYRVSLKQLDTQGADGAAGYLRNIHGTLSFGIGEVQVSASREELKYSASTKRALVAKFNALIEEFVRSTLALIQTAEFSMWQRRVRCQVFSNIGLPVPKEFEELTKGSVKVMDENVKTFTLKGAGGHPVVMLQVAAEGRILMRDDRRKLSGYNLGAYDYVMEPVDDMPIDLAMLELLEVVQAAGIDGIPIKNVSELTWSEPHDPKKKRAGAPDVKHKVRTFVYTEKKRWKGEKLSSFWEVVDRVPERKDVFVIVRKFKAIGLDFFEQYWKDKKIADLMGLTMPVVYGYKTIVSRPIDEGGIVGVHYSKWREAFVKSILAGRRTRKMVETFRLYQLSEETRYGSLHDPADVIGFFGDDHEIVRLVKDQREALVSVARQLDRFSAEMGAARDLDGRIKDDLEADVAVAAIFKKYPLLEEVGVAPFWGQHASKWAEYVRMVDWTSAEIEEAGNGKSDEVRADERHADGGDGERFDRGETGRAELQAVA